MPDIVNAKVVEHTVPMVEDRQRRWQAIFAHADEVIVVHYLVLEPGEQISDTPPEERLTMQQFRQRCAEFGLTPDGQPLEA